MEYEGRKLKQENPQCIHPASHSCSKTWSRMQNSYLQLTFILKYAIIRNVLMNLPFSYPPWRLPTSLPHWVQRQKWHQLTISIKTSLTFYMHFTPLKFILTAFRKFWYYYGWLIDRTCVPPKYLFANVNDVIPVNAYNISLPPQQTSYSFG